MTEDLRSRAVTHLALRQAMGFGLGDHQWLIRGFLDYLDAHESERITVPLALSWACLPQTAGASWRNERLAIIRSFAAHVHADDPQIAELIPAGLIPARVVRTVPYLYSPAQIVALIRRAECLQPPVKGLTLAAIIGVMASTGIRTAEAVALNISSLDEDHGTIRVLGKGRKTRLLPVHSSTIAALSSYVARTRQLIPATGDGAVFINARGSRAVANSTQIAFRQVATACQLPLGPGIRQPRLHDLRHTFAMNILIDAHHNGVGVEARIAALATYLGHGSPVHTYWYLTASPQLLHLVNDRIMQHHHGGNHE
jgi:integrase